jgi:hypothetical protein
MAQASTRSQNPLIGSDRVEGTAVYAGDGRKFGSVKRLMVEKVGGRVAYAIVSFDEATGLGEDAFKIPWAKLTYDVDLGGYHTDVTEEQLHAAPKSARGDSDHPLDEAQEEELHAFFRIPPYWRAL